jgi:MFS family permease
MNTKTRDGRKILLLVGGGICLLAVFLAAFVARENTIYFWDSANYWSKYQELGSLTVSQPAKALDLLVYTVRHSDYNHLPVLFLLPFYLAFGAGRTAFILAVYTLLAVPAVLSFPALVRQLRESDESSRRVLLTFMTLVVLLLFPQFWMPLLYGYVGIGGVAVMNWLNLKLLRHPFERRSAAQLILIGLLLAFLILFRRWYGYWVVAFLLSVFLERSYVLLREHGLHPQRLLALARSLLTVGAAFMGFILLLAWPIAVVMLRTDYSDLYSAYKHSVGISGALQRSYYYFGSWVVTLALLGVVTGLARRRTRSAFRFLTLQFVITMVLFLRTQDFGAHQYYMLMPTLVLFMASGAYDVLSLLRDRRLQSVFVVLLVALSAAQFSVVLVPGTADRLSVMLPLFTRQRQFPQRRGDLQEIRALVRYLEDQASGTGTSIYTVSSSMVMNDSILRNACLQHARDPGFCPSIVSASHVDKRDGFPQQALGAELIVVGHPTQYHMRPEDSRLISVLAEGFTDPAGLGKALAKLPRTFTLDQGAVMEVYRRTGPIPVDALRATSDELRQYYPDRPQIFRIRAFGALQFTSRPGDGLGTVEVRRDHVFMHPGRSTPTTVSIAAEGELRSLSMTLAFDRPERILSACGETGGEVNVQVLVDGTEALSRYLERLDMDTVEVSLDGVREVQVIVDGGRHGPNCDWFVLREIRLDGDEFLGLEPS